MNIWPPIIKLELEELKVDSFKEPEREVCSEHDHVVGVMSEDDRRLYTLMGIKRYEATRLHLEIQFLGKQTSEELMGRFFRLRAEAKLVESLFWLNIQNEFSIWSKGRVGVREGFQIVWTSESQNPFDGLFDNLIGED